MFKYFPLHFSSHFTYCQDAPHLPIALASWQLLSVYSIKEHEQSLRNNIILNVILLKKNLS